MIYALVFTIFATRSDIGTHPSLDACNEAKKHFVAFNLPIGEVEKSKIECEVR